MDLKDLERECLLAEKAHREEDAPGEPSFTMEVAKQTTQKDKRIKIAPGLYADVLLHTDGENPTLVLVKCEDVHQFLENLDKPELSSKVKRIVQYFFKKVGFFRR